jgi:hypothetical protein
LKLRSRQENDDPVYAKAGILVFHTQCRAMACLMTASLMWMIVLVTGPHLRFEIVRSMSDPSVMVWRPVSSLAPNFLVVPQRVNCLIIHVSPRAVALFRASAALVLPHVALPSDSPLAIPHPSLVQEEPTVRGVRRVLYNRRTFRIFGG